MQPLLQRVGESWGFWIRKGSSILVPLSQRCDKDNEEKGWLCLRLTVISTPAPEQAFCLCDASQRKSLLLETGRTHSGKDASNP